MSTQVCEKDFSPQTSVPSTVPMLFKQVWHNHHLGYNIPYGGQSPISVPLFTDQMGVKIRATSNACIFEHGASCQVA